MGKEQEMRNCSQPKRENIYKLAAYIGSKGQPGRITATLCGLLPKVSVQKIDQPHQDP